MESTSREPGFVRVNWFEGVRVAMPSVMMFWAVVCSVSVRMLSGMPSAVRSMSAMRSMRRSSALRFSISV